MTLRRCPNLLEINARILVERWTNRLGRRATLLDVPDEHWRDVAALGFDLVWLMGAWRRSAGSRAVALAHPGLRAAYDEALPGWRDDDVGGSPYAIADYELDPSLGAPGDLVSLRRRLNDLGLGLVLDFVPNHLALDHPWTRSAPERFVHAAAGEVPDPSAFFRAGDVWIAHGRDPYFPPWTDTAQLDAFAPKARAAMIGELLRVADVADGIRCDMAMLLLNEVFARTWGELAGAAPAAEPWSEAVDALRARHPRLLLMAEAYWDLGWRLRELGFDAFYDKTLYDRLRAGDVRGVRDHLAGTARWHDFAVRFVENHDEPRLAAAFGPRAAAAATTALTVPGIRLVHDGQRDGRRVRLPVQLVREPGEPADPAARALHDRLLALANDPLLHEGRWSMLDVMPAGDAEPPLAWCWEDDDGRRVVVVVNITDERIAGVVQVDPGPAPRDALHGTGGDVRMEARDGALNVDLGAGSACIVVR